MSFHAIVDGYIWCLMIINRDLFIKGKFRIKIQRIREKTLEDMRRHRNEAGGEGLPSGAGQPHL
jgi:hypothetical protein